MRAILIPLFISLLCFFLLKALRTQQRRYFALTGLVMGISLYTYQLAQVFPILVGFGFAYDLIARRSHAKKDGLHILLTYGIGFIRRAAPYFLCGWQSRCVQPAGRQCVSC